MFSRFVNNASVIAFKNVQTKNCCRRFNVSVVTFKDKTIVDQVKENAQILAEKAKKTLESATDTVKNAVESVSGENIGKTTTAGTIRETKEKIQDMASMSKGALNNPEAGFSDMVKQNNNDFSEFKQPAGARGYTDKGGFDPRSH